MLDIYDIRGIQDGRQYKEKLIEKCKTRKITKKEIEKYSKYNGDNQKVSKVMNGWGKVL